MDQGDSNDQDAITIQRQDAGLFGRRKPVFVMQLKDKANPPLPAKVGVIREMAV